MRIGPSAWKIGVPWLLVWFRGAVAPALAWWAIRNDWSLFLGGLTIAAFLSDWLDGVLARRWRTSSPALRRADSLADIVFYLNVLGVALIGRWHVLQPFVPPLLGLLALEVVCQTTNYLRFGCGTATHAYLCKAWAVVLCIAAADLFVFHAARQPLWICIVLGYIAYLDVLTILWIMPVPAVDVPTSLHAWRRRAELLSVRAD